MTKPIVQRSQRVAENRHQNGIEQAAAADLDNNRRARARGEEVAEYVPLWKR